MADEREEKLTPELVEQRLRDLAELYELGKALREVRFVSELVEKDLRSSASDPEPRNG